MQRWIEVLVEPAKLILTWQPPDGVADRTRWAVGELARHGTQATFCYFAGAEFERVNQGRSQATLAEYGFVGYPAFNWKQAMPDSFHDRVLDAFLRRVSSPSRSDFRQYLEGFRLEPRSDLTPMALLAVTSAPLPSDGFTLVDPLDPDVAEQDMLLEVTGYHHNMAGQDAPEIGDALELLAEPDNPHDACAVQIRHAGRRIGYVNRLQSASVSRWLGSRAVDAWMVKVNGAARRPKAHMLVTVRQDVLVPAG